MLPIEIPPTAGLPVLLEDFFPNQFLLGDEISKILNIPSQIICCSGTAALIISLKAISDNPKRDTVIIPAFSCPLVVMAVTYCGLKVKLCDTEPNSFDFDFNKLKFLANENTLAIISTHLGGKCANVIKAKQIAQAVGSYVIEDAAQALGAQIAGKSVGLSGDIGFFSLAIGKGLTSYEGGLLFSNNTVLHKKIGAMAEKLQPYNWFLEIKRSIQFLGYFLFYRPFLLPYAYGLPYRKSVRNNDWITALGERFGSNIPMHKLGKWREKRAANAAARLPEYLMRVAEQAEKRVKILESINELIVIKDNNDSNGVWPLIMVLFPDSISRNNTLEILTASGLGVSLLFACALNDYDYLRPHLPSSDIQPDSFPAAKDFSGRLLTISNSPWLEDMQFQKIVDIIKNAIE